jgi:hypothetical protein
MRIPQQTSLTEENFTIALIQWHMIHTRVGVVNLWMQRAARSELERTFKRETKEETHQCKPELILLLRETAPKELASTLKRNEPS